MAAISSNEHIFFSCRSTCTALRRDFGLFFLTELLQLSHILQTSGKNSSLEVIPQHFYWIKVWALTGPLQKVHFLCLNSFCSRFTLLFVVLVLLHPSASSEFQLTHSHSHIDKLNFPLNDGKLYRLRGSIAAPNHNSLYYRIIVLLVFKQYTSSLVECHGV